MPRKFAIDAAPRLSSPRLVLSRNNFQGNTGPGSPCSWIAHEYRRSGAHGEIAEKARGNADISVASRNQNGPYFSPGKNEKAGLDCVYVCRNRCETGSQGVVSVGAGCSSRL